MQVGDLIRDRDYPDDCPGIIVRIDDRRKSRPYIVLCSDGVYRSFPKRYVETDCEIVSENR